MSDPDAVFSNHVDANGASRCLNGSCDFYFYNVMSQYAAAEGASVNLSQAQPRLGSQGLHSLVELAVSSSDQSQVIEFGWTVDQLVNHDYRAHLFVYHRVNSKSTCYNSCGFVPLSRTFSVGSLVKVGQVGTYSIRFKTNRWVLTYNGAPVGYFPESLWKGTFTKVGEVQAFGEVSSSSPSNPDTQMGNGVLGTKPHSAAIENLELIGGVAKKSFSYLEAGPALYRIRPANRRCTTSCGMTFGGPGN